MAEPTRIIPLDPVNKVRSRGYDGPIREGEVAEWLSSASDTVPVAVGDGWRPTKGSGDNVLTFMPGVVGGFGVSDRLLSAVDVTSTPLPSGGYRMDTWCVRRDKRPTHTSETSPGGATSLVVFEGDMGGNASIHGGVPLGEDASLVSYQPLALTRVEGNTGSSIIGQIIDLRMIRKSQVGVADPAALGIIVPEGLVASFPNGAQWVKGRGQNQWFGMPPRMGAGTVAGDYAPAGAGSWTGNAWGPYPVWGPNVPDATGTLHSEVTVPVPQGMRSLVTVNAWLTIQHSSAKSAGILTSHGSVANTAFPRAYTALGGPEGLSWASTMATTWQFEATGPVKYQPQYRVMQSKMPNPRNAGLVGSTWKWEAF